MSEAHSSILSWLADLVISQCPERIVRIGVDGAGKTMFADHLAAEVSRRGRSTIRASVDDFHNPRAQRYARGRSSPDGFFLDSYHYDAFRALLLDPLSPSGSGRYCAKYFAHRLDALVPPD